VISCQRRRCLVESKGYRDLKVWQKAIDLVPMVYEVVRQLPREERYELASQIRRAVVSVPANIAEGQARQHPKEFLQGLFIARGSLAEVETLLIVANRLGYLDEQKLKTVQLTIADLRKPLQGLINRLQRQT
jgi:four helix bundle protein